MNAEKIKAGLLDAISYAKCEAIAGALRFYADLDQQAKIPATKSPAMIALANLREVQKKFGKSTKGSEHG